MISIFSQLDMQLSQKLTYHCCPELVKEVAIPAEQSKPELWKLSITFLTTEASAHVRQYQHSYFINCSCTCRKSRNTYFINQDCKHQF